MDLSSLSNTFSNIGNIAGGMTSGLGAIGALGSFLGLGDSGPSYSEQLAMQYEYQLKAMMQQYQNQMNLQQSANTHQTYLTNLNQKLQKELLQLQQKYQSAEWLSQFNTQAKYNSPSAQVARLRGAGLNPSVLLGSHGAGAAGNSSIGAAASAPSAPPVGSPSVPMGSANALGVTPNYYDFSLKKQESLKALQDIARTSKELGYYDERAKAEISSIWQRIASDESQQHLNEAATLNMKIENELKKTYGSKEMVAKIHLLDAQSYANMAAGDLDGMKTNLTHWQSLRESEEYKALVSRNKRLAEFIQAEIDLLIARVATEQERKKTEMSNQASNYAAAEESRASAKEHIEGARLKGYEADIAGIKKEIDNATKLSRIEQLLTQLDEQKAVSEAHSAEAMRRLELVRKRQNWRHDNSVNRTLDDVLNYLSDAIGLSASISASAK